MKTRTKDIVIMVVWLSIAVISFSGHVTGGELVFMVIMAAMVTCWHLFWSF